MRRFFHPLAIIFTWAFPFGPTWAGPVAAEAAVSDAPPRLRLACPNGGWSAKPLQRLTVLGAAGGTFIVRDAQRREYARGGADSFIRWQSSSRGPSRSVPLGRVLWPPRPP
jgi:hypothetical protein